MKKYIRLLRLKHYIKNILIFLPVIFGKQLLDVAVLTDMLFGLVSFCAVSSAVYIFNDLCDAENDKKHPVKCNRPLANGTVTKRTAVIMFFVLLVICAAANYFACGINLFAWLMLAVYLIQNILYSVKLKQVPILDIAILASGFLLRVFYGSAIADRPVSNWLYLTVIAVSFYLVLGKRRNELVLQDENETRSVLKYYSYNFLDKNMYICSALTIVFYSLWSVDSVTVEFFGSNAIVWTVPVVILICMTYSFAVEKSKADDPVDVLFGNKFLLGLISLYGLSVIGIIYLMK
ncbi:MAG: UbiA prenyltransferase family protein [Clostridia bacterium]|nr:UbiA prenyltransferase family protein [Clostridia bacterium]